MEQFDFIRDPEFKRVWDEVLRYLLYATAAATVLAYVIYAIGLATKKTPKEKYDFVLNRELTAIRTSTICFSLLVGVIVNLLGEEELNKSLLTFLIHFGISLVLVGAFMYLPSMYFKLYYPKIQAKKLNKYRYATRINPATGNKMKLLSEEEEDVYLDPGMQAEEDSFSVDYDVWIDEETGDTIIERYEGRLTALECVNCGFQTLRLNSEELVSAEEEGERDKLIQNYDCTFCKRHEEKVVYVTRDLEEVPSSLHRAVEEVDRVKVEVVKKSSDSKVYEFSNIYQAANFMNEMLKRAKIASTKEAGRNRRRHGLVSPFGAFGGWCVPFFLLVDKVLLRKAFLGARRGIAPALQKAHSGRIAARFLGFFSWSTGLTVHVFLPIPGKGEVDTWPIIRQLWERKVRTATSAPHENGQLRHVAFDEDTRLVPYRLWGIPIPACGQPQEITTIGMAVVPLLAFDKKGNRLGYGRGYYDKFLQHVSAPKVGLSFFPPVERVPTEAHDVPMDYVITPTEVYTFKNQRARRGKR